MIKYNIRLVKEKEFEYHGGTSPSLVAQFARDFLEADQLPYEAFWVFALDSQNKISGVIEAFRGTLNRSLVHPRDVFQFALLQNADKIIIMHNHPSGNLSPGPQDIEVTNVLVEAGRLLGIKLLDHIIIGGDDYTSLRGRGYIDN